MGKNVQSSLDYINNIPRCPECILISSLILSYEEEKLIINYCCENKHNGKIFLEEYMQKYNNHSLLNKNVETVIKIKKKLKENFFIIVNVKNLFAILAY